MNENSREECQKQVEFAVGLAAIERWKLGAFTKRLLNPYENGQVLSS